MHGHPEYFALNNVVQWGGYQLINFIFTDYSKYLYTNS